MFCVYVTWNRSATTKNLTSTYSWTELEAGSRAIPEFAGYIACVVTCVFFGSYYLPVRQFDAGDGVFFQWIQCSAIWTFGVFFHIIIGSPAFEPLAMIGGAMWCTGNLVCIIVLRCIGMGIGMSLWTLVSLILGWASVRYGWFAAAEVPSMELLQYLGIALGVVRGLLAALIEPAPAPAKADPDALSSLGSDSYDRTKADQRPKRRQRKSRSCLSTRHMTQIAEDDVLQVHKRRCAELAEMAERQPLLRKAEADQLPLTQRRLIGIALAAFAGVCFGLQFATINVRKAQGGSQSDMDYSFSFYCGIFSASSVYTVVYALAKRNKPFVNEQLLAPSFLSGLMWVVAQTGWFVANETLSQSITYPLFSAGPAVVGLLWSYFVFREIRGVGNTVLFVAVIICTVLSVLLVSLAV